MSDLVTLNVGGSLYTTTVATLTCYPDSMLGRMFSDRIPTHRDSNGHYNIDRDGPIFRPVLNFLRHPSLCLPLDFKEWDLLSAEADFFQIQELIDAVKTLKEKRSGEGSRQEMEFIEISFFDTNKVTYRGTTATLKDIPTLWLCFENSRKLSHQHEITLHMVRQQARQFYTQPVGQFIPYDITTHNGSITTKQDGVEELDRMKLYQEVTRLGFRLLNTSMGRDEINMQIILFGRNTDE